MKKLLSVAMMLLALTAVSVGAYGQGITTGSITGSVQDSTGAALPTAKVTVTNINTGVSMPGKVEGNGFFTVTNVPVGTYKIAVTSSGFSERDFDRIIVEAGKASSVESIRLAPGSAVETVEVAASAALLETEQAQITTTFDSLQVGNLPTGGGFDELALLIPGVVSTHGNNRSNTNGAAISSNGQRGRNNNFEIDGQSNNDNSVAGPQAFFGNADAIQEIQIITNSFGAQYGRDAGSVVNYITKSGTNAYHGTAFEYYEGSWLSSLTQGNKSPLFGFCAPGQTPAANGCTAVKKPRFDQNIFGGSFGGPILKDRLFGFGSALFSRTYNGQALYQSGSLGATSGYTPTPAGLQQLQAAFPTNPGVLSLLAYGPYAAIYHGGAVSQIPGSQKTAPFSDGTTTIQVPVSLYQRYIAPYNTDEEILGRLDYQATKNDRFFVRYFYQNDPSFPYNATATGAIVDLTGRTHSVGADWTHTFTPNLVNQLRYSFQQSALLFQGGTFASCTGSNFTSCPSSMAISTSYPVTASDGTSITPVASFGLSTSYPQGRTVKDTQIQDNLTWTKGHHTITTGFSYEFQNSPNVFLPNLAGGFTMFGSNGLLQGTGQLGLALGSPSIHFTEPDWAAYFQDDWKVSPDLTVNLGLRWEYFSSSINLLHNISVANQTGSSPLWNTSLPLSQTTFPQVGEDYKHFEPRVGFAWNPSAMKSMVLRGGFSVSISPAFYNIFLNSYGSAPVVLSNTITGCSNATKKCLPAGPATYASVHAQDNAFLPTGGNPGAYSQTLVTPDFRQPITESYTLGIQQQLSKIAVMEIRYSGSHTFADFQSLNANPAIGSAAKAFPTYFGNRTYCTDSTQVGYNGGNGRVNCAATLVRNRQNTAFLLYNGLQASVNTRSYHGLTSTFAYTFSRAIDNASEIFGTNGAGTTVAFSQNPLDTNVGERGVSGNSYPNVVSMSVVYAAPFFMHEKNWKRTLFGGFQFNSIYLYNSGQPYTPYQSASTSTLYGNYDDYTFDATFAGISTARPVLANPSAPINTVGINVGGGVYKQINATGASSPSYARSSFHWIWNNFAEAQALGNPYPGVGRNTLVGGSYNNVDASVFKNNKLGEHIDLQLQLTAFNVLNRAYFGAPDASLINASSTFTNFSGMGGSNRNIQIGARILF